MIIKVSKTLTEVKQYEFIQTSSTEPLTNKSTIGEILKKALVFILSPFGIW